MWYKTNLLLCTTLPIIQEHMLSTSCLKPKSFQSDILNSNMFGFIFFFSFYVMMVKFISSHAHKKRQFWLDNWYQERHTKILRTIRVFDSRSSPTNRSIISLSLVTFLWEIITNYITSLFIIYINITHRYIFFRKWCIVLKVICNDILITSYSKIKLGNYRERKGKK